MTRFISGPPPAPATQRRSGERVHSAAGVLTALGPKVGIDRVVHGLEAGWTTTPRTAAAFTDPDVHPPRPRRSMAEPATTSRDRALHTDQLERTPPPNEASRR